MTTSAPPEGQAKSARGVSNHPLLSLTPQARRQLARTLVQGLAVTQGEERQARTRAGLLGGAGYGTLGVAAFAAWHLATGGAATPFLAFYAGLGAVQAAVTAGLQRQGFGLGPKPVAAVLDGPHALIRAAAAWVRPPRFTPDRLVLAAGILVAARRPVSRRLVVRLYGHAFKQGEVDQAIDLLIRMGFMAPAEAGAHTGLPSLLALTPLGFQLLKGLGVTAPMVRPRRDPVVAQHILPLFAALEGRARRLPVEPEAALPSTPPKIDLPFASRDLPPRTPVAEAEPAHEIFAPAPVAPLEMIVERPVEPIDGEATAERGVESGHPVQALEQADVLEHAESVEVEHETEAAPLDDDLADWLPPGRAKRPLRSFARPVAVAAAIAAVGLLAYFYGGDMNSFEHHEDLAAIAGNMPGPGRGVALQFNGRGKLLSSYGGGLYLSIPDRVDYKTPLSFQNFDMAANCGLVSREVQRASLSPQGRFLWTEMGGEPGAGPRERCLVDLETKTVTHDLVARDATYGLPGVFGWAGDQQMLMSDEAAPHQAAHWWLVDVATNRREAITLPDHARILPVATENGMTMLAGWDMRQRGVWDLTLYRLDEKHTYQKSAHVRTTMPEGLRETEPRVAAVSPDKRLLLVSMRPVGVEVPAQGGSLAVIALSDGTATPVTTSVPPLPDQPVFWAPEVHGGHYRFFFNGGGPDGAVPCTGAVTPSGSN